MKVLILNGSPRINGNTSIAIREMEKVFKVMLKQKLFKLGTRIFAAVLPAGHVQKRANAYSMTW